VIACRVKFQTIEIDEGLDIHVRSLRDLQQFDARDGRAEALGISSAVWPMFGVVWDSGVELAMQMSDLELRGRRILEVGCGLGLASLVLNSRGADVTATDRHPVAEEMLEFNVALNGGRPIPFVRADWADLESTLSRYDLIIGSDLLYMRGHAEAVSGFMGRHARPSCETLLVDPGRNRCGQYNRAMLGLGFTRRESPAPESGRVIPPRLRLLRHSRTVDGA
jgi:predicted nicotinamide N-methyase